MAVNSDKFDLGNAVSGFFGIILSAAIMLVITFFIGLPVFIVVSFVWALLLWFLGKVFGGKATYEKFFSAVAPLHMSLTFIVGSAVIVISDSLVILGILAGIDQTQLAIVGPLVSLAFLPISYAVIIFCETIFVSEVHEISHINALKAVLILAITLFILAFLIMLGFLLVMYNTINMVSGYSRYRY
jgi:hypothetical protein